MTQRPPPDPDTSPGAPDLDIGVATERLFDEIVTQSGNPLLATSLNLMREETRRYRQYEAALIPDREAEYAQLLDCWHRRDKSGLQKALAAYFQRRDDLAAQVAHLIDRPN